LEPELAQLAYAVAPFQCDTQLLCKCEDVRVTYVYEVAV